MAPFARKMDEVPEVHLPFSTGRPTPRADDRCSASKASRCQTSPGLLLLKHMALPSVPSSSANCLPATQVAACRLPASEVTTPPSQVFAVAQEAHGSLTSGSHSEPPPDLHACMITTSHGSTYHAALTVKPTPLPSALHALPYKMPAKGISPHTKLDALLRRTLDWDCHLGTCSCPTP